MTAADDDLLADLARWASAARVDDAVAGRRRETWFLRRMEEEAELAGVVLDLLEAAADVTVRSAAGRVHNGRFIAVGADFTALSAPAGGTTLVALHAISSIRTRARRRVAAAARRPEAVLTSTFGQVLAGLAAESRRVRWSSVADPESGRGELLAVGTDVVTFVLDGDGGAVHVPLATLAEVTVTGFG